jgi:PQQ-dependent dehydrogenase (s-GDH family)
MRVMRLLAAVIVCVSGALVICAQTPFADLGVDSNTSERFARRVVTNARLLDPWDLQWGPDGHLWVTERSAKSIVRIDPATGAKSTLVTIDDSYRDATQDGVLGLALHPGFLKNRGEDHAYVSFVYDADPGRGHLRRMRLRRYTYDARAGVLGSPLDLLSDLPSYEDHAGGRLVIGADQKLYLTIGDLAANHLSNMCQPNRAQELPAAADVSTGTWTAYQGKVLRINLDGSIPADNPVLGGVRSHVYSYGHRNAQGLAVGPMGKLYESEHGPSTDDELNLIVAGKNYGWPFVAGYQDDRSYVYANYSASSPNPCASLAFNPFGGPPSVPQQKETAWSHPDFMAPLQTFFTVGNDYNFAERGNAVIGASGIDVYMSPVIPGWANSVLVASLSRGTLFRVKLSPDGTSVVGRPTAYFTSRNRYRDVTVSPDGRTVFVSVDNWGVNDDPGSILAFTYQGTL